VQGRDGATDVASVVDSQFPGAWARWVTIGKITKQERLVTFFFCHGHSHLPF
jgi:hypothetical protein